MKRTFLAFALIAVACFAGEPLMWFDFSKAENGVVPNLGTGKEYSANIKGKCTIEDGILSMDGLTSQVTVAGTEDFDPSKNYTFMLLYKRENPEGNNESNLSMDTFFAKKDVIVMNKYHTNFYGNARCDKKWTGNSLRSGAFRQDDLDWHHIAISFEYKLNWNDAEEWIEFTFYKDGVCKGRSRVNNVRLDKSKNLLEIGFNSHMGAPWSLGGKIADVRVYEGVMTEAEIREIVLDQKLAKPDFKIEYKLKADEEAALAAKKYDEWINSAIRNLASMEIQRCDWRALMEKPDGKLQVLDGKESCLVLVADGDYTSVCSWYDKVAKREMLKGDNTFVKWQFERWKEAGDGKIVSAAVEPVETFDKRICSKLKDAPKKDGAGAWRFSVQYDSESPAMTALTSFVFAKDRLEFSHTAKSLAEGQTLHSVAYPKCAIRQFAGEGEALVVPEGSGVVYEKPCERNANFSNPYPRSVCSMQFFTYYDKNGGMYVATQDPWARRKEMLCTASTGRMDGSITWRVPYDKPGQPNEFDTGTPAVVELFRGDWYDAGMLYKRDVAAMKADWWLPELPRKTSRKDLMENCIWINLSYNGFIPKDLYKIKEYLGQDIYVGDVWQWWERGVGTHLAPTMRAKPEWIEFVKTLKEHGICTTPYIDGRLWAERDKRGESWMYPEFGHKMNIVSDGKPVREMYKNPCDTVCPATPEYQDHFYEFIKTITMQGLNSLYIDQLGASFPPPCHVAEHGHKYADWYTSYRDGYRKLLLHLREFWAANGKEVMLSTEDAVEPLCSVLDIYQPYRWMHENQIPLFPLVYSGRIQFYNRHALTKEARFQTTAEQLLNSEQPGIFGVGELSAANGTDMRRYVKRLAWTRRALLDFFNCGGMARPPVMKQEMPRIKRRWGKFGTGWVTKPQVQSAAWDFQGTRAVILINTEKTPHSNVVSFELPSQKCEYEILCCDSDKVERGEASGKTAEIPYTLNPQMLMIIVAYPAGKRPEALMAKINRNFDIVRGTINDKDMFVKTNWPDTKPIDAVKGDNLINSAYVTGCRVSKEFGRIDYISYATICPGVVDFGDEAKKEIVLEVACDNALGGTISVYLDSMDNEHLAAELTLGADFKTKDWNTFTELHTKFRQPVSGKHKMIVIAAGSGFCNLRNWRAE